MSKVLIGQYLNELARLRQVSGTTRESVVREAFKDLLKGYARSHDLTCFADHKEKVIDLLARVTRVSVETQAVVEAMRGQARH